MKKAILFIALITAVVFHSEAQEKGDARVHALGTYGLKYKDFGTALGVEYFFAERFALMPSYTKWYPKIGNLGNFSFDLSYYVTEGPSQLYFTAGYSQTFQNVNPGQVGTKQNFKGANAGIGAYVELTSWMGLSTEFRLQTQHRQEAGFRIGLAFPL